MRASVIGLGAFGTALANTLATRCRRGAGVGP
jgi:glycerol-3-phosphate dehydrogenase